LFVAIPCHPISTHNHTRIEKRKRRDKRRQASTHVRGNARESSISTTEHVYPSSILTALRILSAMMAPANNLSCPDQTQNDHTLELQMTSGTQL